MYQTHLKINLLVFFIVASIFSSHELMGQRKRQIDYDKLRRQMVQVAVVGAGVKDKRVIESMMKTPRHEFMPKNVRHLAHIDAGVPIGEQQTISSPFIVAYMTESLEPRETDKVLEIGTGSGYQAAVLSPLVKEVYSIEIVEKLGKQARKTLDRLKYKNVFTKIGDGFKGWKEKAPFDKIIVTCSPEKIPKPLVDQLKEGGLIVVPVGERHQQTLYLMRKKEGKLVREALRPTLFVPMTGTAEKNRKVKPDPSNPKLLNGDFEEDLGKNGFVKGWYYQRQLKQVEDEVLAPSGQRYVQFENTIKGKPAHLMQAFAIDGRKVKKLRFSFSAKCDEAKRGWAKDQVAMANLEFFDDQRRRLAMVPITFLGTRAWRTYSRDLRVPKGTREALVRIGMFGGTGKAAFDDVVIRKLEVEKK